MFPQPFGKYVLERELARGGMARVLLATLRGAGGFEKRLVVKQVRDELAHDVSFVRRFVDEAKTAVALGHPNIVPVYELGVEQGTYFIAMEFVEGKSVAELLRALSREGEDALTAEEGAYLGVEMCRALDYAHRMHVVHRDVTPRNVMIDEEGAVKIIDFGIAAPVRGKSGEVFGSPGHMPPEQAEGKELGPYTDVFAIAVLLIEAWSGKPAFRRGTPEASEEALRAEVPRPSMANEALAPLDTILLRALHLDPKERVQAADELGRALRGYLASRGADTQDVARGLGEKVRRLRKDGSPDSTGRSPRVPWRGSSPSFVEVSTKTFAVRLDVDSWPAIAAAPESVTGPSTRKMPSDEGDAPLETGPIDTRSRSDEAPPSEAPRSDGEATGDLIATTSAPPEPTPRRSSRAGLVIGIGIAASALAIGLFLVTRREVPPDRPRPVTATPAPPPTAIANTIMAPVPETAPVAPTKTSATPASVPGPAVEPRAATSAGPTSAVLSLLGSSDTRVSIDGQSKGNCPTQATVRAGSHEVRFIYAPTGEARAERITVKSTEHVTVRADFTAVTPTIKVQR